MEHELIPIPSRYRFLLHLLAGMCLGILANCSGDSNLDLYSIQTFLGDINRLVFNNFFDEEMKKVDEIVLNQANNRRNNQNNKHMEIKIKKCNDVRNYDMPSTPTRDWQRAARISSRIWRLQVMAEARRWAR